MLAKNLENYPAHEASILFLGKSLFRLGKVDDAWTAFRNVSESSLDSESKYEYGYSAYRSKAWEKAARVLVSVPDSNQNYDLAMYYASVSLLNLNRFKEAEATMKKAVVLPSRFLSSRKAILKFLQNENSEPQQSHAKEPISIGNKTTPKSNSDQVKNSNEVSKVNSNSRPPQGEPQGRPKNRYPMTIDSGAEVLYADEKELEVDGKEAPQWQPGPESSMGLMVQGERLLQDMGGVTKDIKSLTRTGAYLKGQSQSHSAGFGLAVDYELSGASLTTQGMIKPVGLAEYKDLDMWESAAPYFSDPAPKSQLSAKLGLGIQYQASDTHWLVYGGGKSSQLSEASHRSLLGGARLEIDGEHAKLSLGSEINDWRGSGYEHLKASSAYGKALFPLKGNLNLGIAVARHMIENPPQTLEYPLGLNQIEISTEQGFALGFKLRANAGLMRIENYLRGNLQSGTTVADGTRVYAGIVVSWNPLKWLMISAKQQNASLRWSNIEPSSNNKFWAEAVPDYAEYSHVEFKVYRPF